MPVTGVHESYVGKRNAVPVTGPSKFVTTNTVKIGITHMDRLHKNKCNEVPGTHVRCKDNEAPRGKHTFFITNDKDDLIVEHKENQRGKHTCFITDAEEEPIVMEEGDNASCSSEEPWWESGLPTD